MNRRQFFLTTAGAAALQAAPDSRTKIGLVRSTHANLRQPASLEDGLSYDQVRDMVFTAIDYGAPKVGSLADKIKPGSWVVIKPNIVFLRPHPAYALGDITDFRVTQAVLEYVATRSKAARVTIAEGGTYRRPSDKAEDNVVTQGGKRVSAIGFEWGHEEFPGFDGSLGSMLRNAAMLNSAKKFDYVDLSYDCVRGPDGKFKRIEVPKAPNGQGAFGGRSDYFVTNTITGCDFLISVPVMKVHLQSGITAVLKNYVGTAPREAYALPGGFHNAMLHEQHSAGDRIDPFICDLAAFHPPDYCVIDGIRGLQSQEHFVGREDQTVRSNLVMACEDPVMSDAMVARLMGFNPHDIDFLQMASKRMMGSMDLSTVDLRGDEPDRDNRNWEKPKRWYGRCNREWRLSAGQGWQQHTAPFDTLDLAKATGVAPASGRVYKAAVTVDSRGHQKGFLWLGVRGSVTARCNGETMAQVESDTRYRVGQFQFAVSLKPGKNELEFTMEPRQGQALLSALVTGKNNSGDTPDGIRWRA